MSNTSTGNFETSRLKTSVDVLPSSSWTQIDRRAVIGHSNLIEKGEIDCHATIDVRSACDRRVAARNDCKAQSASNKDAKSVADICGAAREEVARWMELGLLDSPVKGLEGVILLVRGADGLLRELLKQ